MKNFKGIRNVFIKRAALVLLACCSFVLFALGFSGMSSESSVTDAAAATALKAWYRFDSLATYGKDMTGNGYDLTSCDSSSYTEATDGLEFVPLSSNPSQTNSFAANARSNDPTYQVGATDSWTIATTLRLGTSAGGANEIITNGNWNSFRVSYVWGTLTVSFDSTYEVKYDTTAIPTTSMAWYRLIVTYDGAGTIKVRLAKAGNTSYIKATGATGTIDYGTSAGNVVTISSSYSLYKNASATYNDVAYDTSYRFCLNGKMAYYDVNNAYAVATVANKVGVGSAIQASGIRMNDLRFYNGVIDAGELAILHKGDAILGTACTKMVSYEDGVNESTGGYYKYNGSTWVTDHTLADYSTIGYDNQKWQSLARTDTVKYDAATASYSFTGANCCCYSFGVTSASGFYQQKQDSTTYNLDWSDYVRKGPFSVAVRFYAKGVSSGGYYIFSTGTYANGTAIGVGATGIVAYVGNGLASGAGGANVEIRIGSFFTTTEYCWVNAILVYDGSTATLYAKKDGGDWQTASKTIKGGSFGGYPYSFTIGGQSLFGQNFVMSCYDSANGITQTKMRSLTVYGGSDAVISSQVNNMKEKLERLVPVVGTTSSFTKIAQYKFDGSTTVGKNSVSSTGSNYDLVNPGNMTVNTSLGGLTLDAETYTSNNSSGSTSSTDIVYAKKTNPTHILYAQRGSGGSENSDWSDKYQGSFSVSFRVYTKKMSSRSHKIFSTTNQYGVSDKYSGCYAAIHTSTLEVVINGSNDGVNSTIFFTNLFEDTAKWYRIFLMHDISTERTLVVVFCEETSTYLVQECIPMTHSASSIDTGFGGNPRYDFTIGGQSIFGNNVDGGAGGVSEGFSPTLSEFTFYSGCINTSEITSTLTSDSSNISLDTSNSSVDMNVGSNMNVNHNIKFNKGLKVTMKSVEYSFNGHTQTVTPVFNSSKNAYVATMTLMAPQDMNDKIEIKKITYDQASVTGNVAFTIGCDNTLTGTKTGSVGLTKSVTTRTIEGDALKAWSKYIITAQSYLGEIANSSSATDTQKKIAKALLNYGTAAQEYWPQDSSNSINSVLTNASDKTYSLTSAQTAWVEKNAYLTQTVKNFNNLKVQKIDSANIIVDNNFGIGLVLRVAKGLDVSGYSYKVFSGEGTSGTTLVNVKLTDSSVNKLTADGWSFDRYQIGYENVLLGGLATKYTFVVYDASGSVVTQVTMNAAAVLKGNLSSSVEKEVNLAKSIIAVYCAASGIA